ncbi:MAG: acyl-CoA ligase (AMP-forming), exosortase A system-associated [Halothiobacillaceae bacterium]|nr:MAG: acyl-CoA ligase (AMP-forming), exosortase A system-associated [Halothiobacillaceae bacterium]
MSYLLHHPIEFQTRLRPDAPALMQHDQAWTYAELAGRIDSLARGLHALGLRRGERVAVWLPKSLEGIALMFAISRAGGVLVPVNPLLRPAQVAHILADCGARMLITQAARLKALAGELDGLHDLRWALCVDQAGEPLVDVHVLTLAELEPYPPLPNPPPPGGRAFNPAAMFEQGRTEHDLAALLYTSGSTGRPKGVMLSHRNLLAGAASVAHYLGIRPDDRLLGVLPLSFDYGLSQLTVAFHAGASVMPLDYLLPRDLHRAITQHRITVLAGVPTLWHQLAAQDWLGELESLRVLTNSGGRLPRPVIDRLRAALPSARLFLMYGLTEAFRSTWLPPEELDRRPDSIGKAIPNAEVMVLRPDGTPCAPHEPGELVHRGPTVGLGYWNDPERTAERYRPMPHAERAVWSGDRVRMDEDGFLYFIGRDDDMLKSSGYRVSPTEVEDALYASGLVREAAAIGIDDDTLGQRIVAVVASERDALDTAALLNHCRAALPLYMVPQRIEVRASLPVTPNGKVDRRALRDELAASTRTPLEPV